MILSSLIDFSWRESDVNTFFPILCSIISFGIYWFTSKNDKVKVFFFEKFSLDQASVHYITFQRIVGFITMGLITGILALVFMPDYSLRHYGLTFNSKTAFFTIFWSFVLIILVVPLAYFSARKPKNLINYPQIRARIWTWKIALINALGWTLYLLGYEFLFRGVLLFPLVDHLGVWTAIAINVALYSATHIPKGLDETIGSILLGFVLCILTLASGTVWIAFFVHVALALTNSFTALKYHPDMHFKKSRI